MKAIITPETFAPIKLSRILHALTRIGQFYVNVDGELYGHSEEAAMGGQPKRANISGEQFFEFFGLEALGCVVDLGWKDGTFTYKDLPVLKVSVVETTEDAYTTTMTFAPINYDYAVAQLMQFECQEEKHTTSLVAALHRTRGLNLILDSVVFKLFNLVQMRELYFDNPEVSTDERVRILTERNTEAEDLRLKSMTQIANNLMPYSKVGCTELVEVRQSRMALQTARKLNLLTIAEAAEVKQYNFFYKEADALREETYKMSEIVDLGMPVNV